MDSFVGKTIGNYQVIEEIGRGTFTRVYKVWDSKLNRNCALKVLEKDSFPAELFERVRNCFEKEARATAKLHHDAIIKIFDYGEFEGTPFIITEYAEGGSLDKHLGKIYTETQASSLIASVAEALDYAHSKGILHRDIKPSNILLWEDGSPILTDFGIANMMDERDESGKTLAETTLGLGAVEYTAPEQSMGKDIDGRADQFSLGVIFYELLTGHKPFSGETPMEVLVQQYSGTFRSPKNDGIELSSDTLKILEKSLSKDPGNRFASIEEFSTAVRGISTKKSVSKAPAGKIIAIFAAVLLLAAAGLFFFRPEWIPGSQPASTIESQTITLVAPDRETPIMQITATGQPSATHTLIPTHTFTAEPIATDTSVPTATETFTPTNTETAIPTDTSTPTATETPAPTATETSTPTAVPTETPEPTATPLAFSIGYGSDFYTLEDAWRELPENAGVISLYLDNIKQLDGFISVPTDKGITGLILDSRSKHTITCSGTRLFANGIPLMIGKDLTMSGLTIFGGTYAVGNTDKTIPSAELTVYGTVADVFAGGEIRGEGSYQGSASVENAAISIYGTVTHNVYGGGYAVGEGSRSHVGESRLYLDKWGRINGTLYYGGLASSICPGSGDSCGLEHGIVTMGTVYADISGEILNGVKRSSFSTIPAEPEKTLYYAPEFDFIETEASREQAEAPEPVRQEMLIAWGQECADLSCAMNKIDPKTTDLLIKIGYSFTQNYSLTIPNSGNALRQVTLDADTPMTVNMQNLGIYANGVRLIIGENITLQGSIIYAGGNADSGMNNKDSAELVINGTVGTVYAGGAAGCPNCSASVGESTVTINGFVTNTVYGGGFAAEKGARAVNSSTTLILSKTSRIRQNLYLGWYAVNYCDPAKRGTPEECDHAGSVSVGTVNAALYGEVTGDIYESGFSAEGAPSTIAEIIYIEAPEAEMMDRTDPLTLRIGDYEEHRTLRHALQSIRYPGGDVILQLTGKLIAAEDLILPNNKAIRSLRIESDRENAVRTLDLNNKMLFANGVPLTIGKDITIINGSVLAGGKCTNGTLSIPEATLIIDGAVINNIYGGGAAACSGTLTESCTSNVESSSILLNGTVQGNIYLGGLTMGSGSKASLTDTVQITMTNNSLLRGNLYFTGNPLSESNREYVSYCEFNKIRGGICEPDYLASTGTVNRAEAALYGTINGSVIKTDLTGPANTIAELNEYAYLEADPTLMNLEDPQLLRIGLAEAFTSLPTALENIRYSVKGTDVVLKISGNLYLNENITLPYEKNIKTLRIETDRDGINRTIDLGNKSFFACGVPLTIGENIFLTGTNLYAGKLLQAETGEEAKQYQSKSVVCDSGKITILGTAANVYAGGRAVGPGCESAVGKCVIDIQGTVQQSVFGGGSAVNGGSAVVDETIIKIGPAAKINANIYCGGTAEFSRVKGINEEDSFSEVKSITIKNNGEFSRGHIFEQGMNSYGGVSAIGSISYQ